METSPEAPLRALRRLMRPLVRLLVAKHVTYPAFMELIKSLYVQVATEEFALEGRPQTDSRITLLTGIQRREVKRISELEDAATSAAPAVSMGAQIVARWISDKRYLDSRGKPLPLARSINEGGEKSFEALVASISKDFRSRPVLDEWLRLGAARLDEDNLVHLNATSFVPRKGFDEKLFYFGFNLHDHIAASVNNVLETASPMFERSAHAKNMGTNAVEKLRKLSTEVGESAIKKVVATAMRLDAQQPDQEDTKHRVTFGVYFFCEPVAPVPDQETAKSAAKRKRRVQ